MEKQGKRSRETPWYRVQTKYISEQNQLSMNLRLLLPVSINTTFNAQRYLVQVLRSGKDYTSKVDLDVTVPLKCRGPLYIVILLCFPLFVLPSQFLAVIHELRTSLQTILGTCVE